MQSNRPFLSIAGRYMRAAADGFAVLCLGLLMTAMAPPALAQSYPDRPVRWIVPWPAGGGADLMARIVNAKAGEYLGQPLVIDNRGGAAGNIGASMGATAAPDGYNITFAYSGTHSINPFIYPKMGWKQSDFVPVIFLTQVPLTFVVNPKLPAKNLREFIALAKTRQLTFGSSGQGSINHLAGELFASMTGTKMLHVPYRGGGPALNAILGGEVDALFMVPVVAAPHIRAGKLQALGVTSVQRASALPDVPTIAEAGLPGYDVSSWNGVLVPVGTPSEVIAKLNAAFNRAMADPEVRKQLVENGYDVEGGEPDRFSKWIDRELAKWGPVVKKANVTIE